jgi:hypothetical protein
MEGRNDKYSIRLSTKEPQKCSLGRGLRSGLRHRTEFQGTVLEIFKKGSLRLISTAGKRAFKTCSNRYQLTFGKKAKKASGKCQGFQQDKLA